MKILKIILIIILAILTLLLITAAFVKKDYEVVREVTIQKPKNEVFEYIKFIKHQDEFSVWQKLDPNMKKVTTGTDGTVGFVSRWESEHPSVGVGEQEIINIEEGKKIEQALRFYVPWESTGIAYLETTAKDSATTQVKWGFNSSFKYPSNLMLLFMDMDSMLGNDFENGLANLKQTLEGTEEQEDGT